MKGERDERARAKVLEVLASGGSVTAAAKAAGVARQTPYQWADRGDTEMADALAASKQRGRGEGKGDGPGAPRAAPARREKPHPDENLALDTLREVARGNRDGEGCSPGAHVQAAKALLEHHRKRREEAKPKVGAGAPPRTGEAAADPAKPKRSKADLLKLITGGA
jgi:transposase-like protein